MSDLVATYRIQLHEGWTFDDTVRILDDLVSLGVSHLYLSPVFRSSPGSTHGYDVVDPMSIDPERGGPEGFERLRRAAQERRLGIVIDIVPNHMATDPTANIWWRDVLEEGSASPYARFFDIDSTAEQLLIPVLASTIGEEIDTGSIRIVRSGARVEVEYADLRFPVSTEALKDLLRGAASRAGGTFAQRLEEVAGMLPDAVLTTASLKERDSYKRLALSQLAKVLKHPEAAAAVDAEIEDLSSTAERLDAFLGKQHYRLAWWKLASEELEYRRFFDIDSLVGVRVEDEEVFDQTHALIIGWLTAGHIDGLRVDHPDGLFDPAGYMARLREAAPYAWILVEKIAAPQEELPDWPVDGSTGYDFARLATGLFVDPRSEAHFDRIWERFDPAGRPFHDVAIECRKSILDQYLVSDLERLTTILGRLCSADRHMRDHTRSQMRLALREMVAHLPVYRTYVEPGSMRVVEAELAAIRSAAAEASKCVPQEEGLIRFIAELLTSAGPGEDAALFVRRFQQLTPPVAAKGEEDTAFYRYLRYAALNEVGSDPSRFGVSPDEFHAWCARTARRWPRTMLATSTHDTKRSEDVRARLAALSHIPWLWEQAVERMEQIGGSGSDVAGPDRYLLYQTMVAAAPVSKERLQAYMLKAVREAKLHTSWTDPDDAYEGSVMKLIEAVTSPRSMEVIDEVVDAILVMGRRISLGQLALKLTSPGVPDFYQGQQGWDLSLVDPDNRRPVDHAALASMGATAAWDMTSLKDPGDQGRTKYHLTRTGLQLRRALPEVFPAGSYEVPAGSTRGCVCFGRGTSVIACVVTAQDDLGEIAIEDGRFVEILSGREVVGGTMFDVADLVGGAPVAIFSKAG